MTDQNQNEDNVQDSNPNAGDAPNAQAAAKENQQAQVAKLKARATELGIELTPQDTIESVQAKITAKEVEVVAAIEADRNKLEQFKLEAESLEIEVTDDDTVQTLGAKILAYQQASPTGGQKDPLTDEDKVVNKDGESEGKTASQLKNEKIMALKRSANKLIRVRIICNDRKLADRGCVYRNVGNSHVTCAKVIPLDTPTHVPELLIKRMKDEKFISFRKKKMLGADVADPRELKTFIIEELPPLTKGEFDKIAIRQQASKNVD